MDVCTVLDTDEADNPQVLVQSIDHSEAPRRAEN
jgi:hypothetical protein